MHRLAVRVSTGAPRPNAPQLTDLPTRRRRIYELQAFLVELVSNFHFELTDDVKRVRKTTAIVMVPIVDSEVCMPLRVSLAPPEGEDGE